MDKLNIEVEIGKNDICKINLNGEITIYTVKDLKESLVDHIDRFSGIRIDLSAVDRIDTAGFQLLLCTMRENQGDDTRIRFNVPSDEVKSIFEFYRCELN